jgi:hypothetical protein
MKYKYDYGSSPMSGYSHVHFVRHLAPVLPKDDQVFFHRKSLQWREDRDKIPLGLFRNICHWKSPRRFVKNVLNNSATHVNKRWKVTLELLNDPPFSDEVIKKALKELTKLDGVEVPTASALLTAWNPNQFGIVDFKTLAVLEMSRCTSRSNYVVFRNKLLELKETYSELHNCAVRQIELALWHYHPIWNSKSTERPGRSN